MPLSHAHCALLVSQMEECLDAFQYEMAVRFGLRAVQREPNAAHVLEEVGPVLLELGHTEEALEVSCAARECAMHTYHVTRAYMLY